MRGPNERPVWRSGVSDRAGRRPSVCSRSRASFIGAPHNAGSITEIGNSFQELTFIQGVLSFNAGCTFANLWDYFPANQLASPRHHHANLGTTSAPGRATRLRFDPSRASCSMSAAPRLIDTCTDLFGHLSGDVRERLERVMRNRLLDGSPYPHQLRGAAASAACGCSTTSVRARLHGRLH